MGVIYRLDCPDSGCRTGVIVRDKTLAEAVELARPHALVLRCPVCNAELYTYAEAAPLDLGLLREGAEPHQGRRP